MEPDSDWEARMLAVWQTLDHRPDGAFLASITEVADELPSGSPVAAFELGAAFDSTGHTERAVPLYERALEAGLSGERRRRAVIQLSSSLRNLGQAPRAVALLQAELAREPDALTGAVGAFLALALLDVHREREAVAVALEALSTYLPRYNRSLSRYARALTSEPRPEDS